MAIPTYRGVAVFGSAVVVEVQDQPADVQEAGYPGLEGVESGYLGGRGRIITVTGVMQDPTAAGLTVRENSMREKKDGVAGTLVDTSGYSWPACLLQTFDPTGPRRYDPGRGYIRPYRSVFRALI